uniref:Uncharacterized protein n=1 Tax=Rhizophora mucronata TaxID=61149 RepID=A0A2P2NLZ6_RHIMU
MAQQEDGWPLGLRLLNARVGLGRNQDFNGSVSFSTLLTSSSSSSMDSSSDLDTESTGSFFHDKSITLGSLIGVSSILEFSRRSTRRTAEALKNQKNNKSRPWLFSLCSRLSTDAISTNNTPSLRHFLQVERRAANSSRRNFSPTLYGTNDFSPVHHNPIPSSLFVGDHISAQSNNSLGSNGGRRSNTELLEGENGYGAPLMLSCLCGQLTE